MKVMGDLGQIVPVKYDPRNLQSIERAVAHSNVVINLIGNTRATSNFSLDDTNRKIARLSTKACFFWGASFGSNPSCGSCAGCQGARGALLRSRVGPARGP